MQHRAGTKHGNADGLSRRPATADSGETALGRVAVVSTDAVVDATVVAEQHEAAREHLGMFETRQERAPSRQGRTSLLRVMVRQKRRSRLT